MDCHLHISFPLVLDYVNGINSFVEETVLSVVMTEVESTSGGNNQTNCKDVACSRLL